MDVEPKPIQSIFHFRDAPQRRQRRQNRPRKGEDPGSEEDRPLEPNDDKRLDLIA